MHETIFQTKWGWVGVAATGRGVQAIVLPKPTRQAVEKALGKLSKESPSPLPSPSRGEGNKNAVAQNIPSPPSRGRGMGEGVQDTASHILTAARSTIEAYLEGKVRRLDVPVDFNGQTPFHRKVWEVLQRIPYGRVRSYGWVARKVGKPKAARAVGAACGANPVPLLVPCHRVIAGDGSLGGFSGGLGVKKRLLKLEGIYF